MTQERLNYAMMLLIHKGSADKLDLIDIINMFCERNDERQRVFRVFYKENLKLA